MFTSDNHVVMVTQADGTGVYYSIYYLNDKGLGMFDLTIQEDVLTVPGSLNFVAEAVQDQYRNIWYYSRRDLEGASAARMLDMSTLVPIVNPDELLKDERTNKFMIVPFGDYFLIGTDSHVMVLSMNGTINKTYRIPKEWLGKDYVLLEYRK